MTLIMKSAVVDLLQQGNLTQPAVGSKPSTGELQVVVMGWSRLVPAID